MGRLLLALMMILSALATAAESADPYTGTWRLSLQKSTADSRSQVLTISVRANEEHYRSELVLPDGTRQVTSYTAAYDGEEHASTTVVTDSQGRTTQRDDTVILRKINELTRERQWKSGGRLIRILRRAVSPDHRQLTSHVIDVDEQGQEHPVSTLVFEKTTAP